MTHLGLGLGIYNQRNAGGGISRTNLRLWKKLQDGAYVDRVVEGNLNIIDSTQFFFMGHFTLEFWVKLTDLTAAYNILQKKTANNVSGYGCHLNTDGTIQLEYSDGTNHFSDSSTTAISTMHEYHHIAIVRDHVDVKFYINKVLDTTISNGTAQIAGNTDSLTIASGTGGTAGGTNFTGVIDDIRIYNHALLSDNVTRHYNLGYNKYLADLYEFSNEFSSEFS